MLIIYGIIILLLLFRVINNWFSIHSLAERFYLFIVCSQLSLLLFFFLNDRATPEIYPFPLHHPLPISLFYIGWRVFTPRGVRGFLGGRGGARHCGTILRAAGRGGERDECICG